jgi:hypothetical protein
MSQPQCENDQSLLLIVPYFGAFPAYADLFFESCAANPSISWLLVTDQRRIENRVPKNVRVATVEFADLVAHINDVMGFRVVIPRPYKLCDIKPAYGVIFAKYISGFDYWGHCDMDMIFGNLRKFLTRDLFARYEKLLICGHLSIYRNSDTANNYFRLQAPGIDYRKVFSSARNYWFDEWKGIAKILVHHKIAFFNGDIFADIDTHYYDFRTTQGENHRIQIFSYEDGKVFKEYYDGAEWRRSEFAYIHLQKRALPAPEFSIENNYPLRYLITPRGFIPRPREQLTVWEAKRLNPKAAVLRMAVHSLRMLKKRAQSHL